MVALASLAGVPAASAATFGANLDRQPDGTYSCADFGAGSCTWTSTDLTTGESGVPPAGVGVVSRVSVRVGPVTGPMQIVELEGLSQYASIEPIGQARPGTETLPLFSSALICCTAVGLSDRFTPQPNSTTSISVHLPLRQDVAPDPGSRYAVSDFLTLSVLAPNVPIPTSSAPSDTTSDGTWSPAWDRRGEKRFESPQITGGAIVLFSASWNRASPVALSRQTARVRGHDNAALHLVCNLARGCHGLVTLQSPTGRSTYGSANYAIQGGERAMSDVRLNRAGRRLLRNRHSAQVWADFAVNGASAYPDHAMVTLRG